MRKRIKNVRLGIIGIGVESEVYANFLTEGKVKNMVLGAICDIDPDRKVMYAEKYPSIPFYDHYIDMLPFDEELFLNELNKRIEVEKSQINSRGEHK